MLAATGGPDISGWLVGARAMLFVGAAMMVAGRARRFVR
jgi:hypothetical protein